MPQQTMTVTGVVLTDPTYHQVAADNGVCNFRVGAHRSRLDEEGNWKECDELYVSVEAWRKLAENTRRSIAKGMSVIVVGILVTRTWEDKDGNPRSKLVLRASHIGPDLGRYLTNTVSPTQTVMLAAPDSSGNLVEQEKTWIDSSSYQPSVAEQTRIGDDGEQEPADELVGSATSTPPF
ncbi:single-stranded DNA-binding protein [Corynebacterium choanae]|uniref:Single-stranded DNA-binding protein n=1 Tax=Corynebacterium choanae TaxID=1862358 RepID=A0A3G6J8M0_9CORY|nr:single-stranded DNA-binding protein [Corynebacterium choanae]AZA14152.1 Single-stranded DNA-binding protein [Corynebacterium choanae]